jgi:hypothetical protein
MTGPGRYATPAAFRNALTDRIKAAARDSRWTIGQLQRQVAYDRLLERLYLLDDGWIVKGATALLARDLGVRGSLDIDLYRNAAREPAEADLRRAAATDIGDGFRFEVGVGSPIAAAAVRLAITARIGTTTWVAFRVDLVGESLTMTGQPEAVPPLARGIVPEVAQHGYRAYPLVDHIADKVAAMYERHGRTQMASTRFRDLVDLVAIVRAASVEGAAQHDVRCSPLSGHSVRRWLVSHRSWTRCWTAARLGFGSPPGNGGSAERGASWTGPRLARPASTTAAHADGRPDHVDAEVARNLADDRRR